MSAINTAEDVTHLKTCALVDDPVVDDLHVARAAGLMRLQGHHAEHDVVAHDHVGGGLDRVVVAVPDDVAFQDVRRTGPAVGDDARMFMS